MVLEGVITPKGSDCIAYTMQPAMSKMQSLLLNWEQAGRNVTNLLLQHIHERWSDKQGMIIMLDNPHPSDAEFIIRLNTPVAIVTDHPPVFSYGSCSSKFDWRHATCDIAWSQCAEGYTPFAYNSLSMGNPGCLCTCCLGRVGESDCGFGTAQFNLGIPAPSH